MAVLVCDASGCGGYADVLVSQIANGETVALCGSHYVQACLAVAESQVQSEVDTADAEALARLGNPPAPDFPSPPEPSGAAAPARAPRSKRGAVPEPTGSGADPTPDDGPA